LATAIFVLADQAFDGIELAAEPADALQQFYLFAFLQGHGTSPLAIYPSRV
jgi:hypothetical protein